jgi:GNAT superfamily N-acetyltransferase
VADVSVRPARPEDAELVARVQLSTWRTAYGELLPAEALELPLEQVAAVWLHAVEVPPSPRHRLLVALEGAELVGFAASAPATDEDLDAATTSEITALLVEPRWGRRGHGSRLLAATVDHWRTDGTALGVTWAFEGDAVTTGFLQSAGWGPDGLGRGLDTGPRVVHQRRLHTDLTAAP